MVIFSTLFFKPSLSEGPRFSMAKGVLVFMELVGTSRWYKLTPVLLCFVFTIPQILVLEQIIMVIPYEAHTGICRVTTA